MQNIIEIRRAVSGVLTVIIRCPFAKCNGQIEIKYSAGGSASSGQCSSCGVVVALTEESKKRVSRRKLEIDDRVCVKPAFDEQHEEAVGIVIGFEVQDGACIRTCVVRLENGEEIKVPENYLV